MPHKPGKFRDGEREPIEPKPSPMQIEMQLEKEIQKALNQVHKAKLTTEQIKRPGGDEDIIELLNTLDRAVQVIKLVYTTGEPFGPMTIPEMLAEARELREADELAGDEDA
jgi:hypothetical protein